MLVYIVLIGLFVAIPVQLLRTMLGGPLVLHLWTLLPELRVPLELALLHLSFLTLFDKHKQLIGQLQYNWLCFTCSRLGLSRFLLPYQCRREVEDLHR